MVEASSAIASLKSVFSDVTPLEQYEGGLAPIAPIHYSEEYSTTMGYFRAILKAQEKSQRAFDLTKSVIKMSTGNYTAWHYRRVLLDELKIPLTAEMDYLREIGLDYEKNYQIWHHRRCISEVLADKDDLKKEKQYLKAIFQSDAKNYHAWSYRVWLVERFQLWDGELEEVERLLDEDVCNNSVWSYRYFLLHRSPAGTFTSHLPDTQEFVKAELEYVLHERLPYKWNNEACWVYMRGLLCLTEAEEKQSTIKRVFIGKFHDLLEPFVDNALEKAEAMPEEMGLRFFLMIKIDLHLSQEKKEQAKVLMECLRDKADKIRRNYWQWRINQLEIQ